MCGAVVGPRLLPMVVLDFSGHCKAAGPRGQCLAQREPHLLPSFGHTVSPVRPGPPHRFCDHAAVSMRWGPRSPTQRDIACLFRSSPRSRLPPSKRETTGFFLLDCQPRPHCGCLDPSREDCGRCVGNYREGRRILSLRHGCERNDVGVCRAYPTPAPGRNGVAGAAFFNAMRLATNVGDIKCFVSTGAQGSRNGAVATHGMIYRHYQFIYADNIKALISVREAQRMAFNDRVAKYEGQCVNLVVNDRA